MSTANTIGHFACAANVVGEVINLNQPKPPFITHPDDENSLQHMRNCMAWWLASTKTHAQTQEFLASQRPATQQALHEPISQCYAWLWLITLPAPAIHQRLQKLHGSEVVKFKQYLNHYRAQAKEATKNKR